MEALAPYAWTRVKDKWFDLAIVDPPYGAGDDLNFRRSDGYVNDVPDADYFIELRRVSVNQIICGGNYFTEYLPASRGWVFWYKHQPISRFSDGEFIWTSFDCRARCFDYPYSNVMEGSGSRLSKSIHPTQKPIALYKWLLTNYAKPGDTILDTHLGSGSSRIAAYDLGFDFTGYELDTDYFNAQEKRFADHIAQPKLFAPDSPVYVQENIFADSVDLS
jgi:site-specific DNA-methyltransferase (adenine-specific)